ncbi:hypothetical protein HYPSUDRAFT_40058, partial [Hypholoma sublateritium FD-334 SS-4]
MIFSKVMRDDTYSNKSWCIVAQGIFTLREVNQMEREMCNYLDWELTVDDPILTNFEQAVKANFRETRTTYPNYPTTSVSKRAARAEASTPINEKSNSTSPIPTFATSRTSSSSAKSTPTSTLSKASWSADPKTPDTPSPSYSDSTSPTSTGSPATPVGGPETNPKICGVDSSPSLGQYDIPPATTVHPLKPKMFAFAIPS